MKKVFILKKKNNEMYIVKSGALGYALSPDIDSAYKFNYVDSRNFIKNSRGRYGMLDLIEYHCERKLDSVGLEDIQRQLDFNSTRLDLHNILNTMLTLKDDLLNEKKIYISRLKKLERARLDLNHYKEIKLKNVDKTNIKHKEVENLADKILLKRREVKDNIRIIDIILNSINDKYSISSEIEKMNNRQYTPREFDELFDDNIVPNFNDWWKE